MFKKDEIIIKGARLNNLKNISVNIPKNKIVVIPIPNTIHSNIISPSFYT